MARRPLPRLEVFCPRKLAGIAAMRCGFYQSTDGCGAGCSAKADAETIRNLHVVRGDFVVQPTEAVDELA